MRKLLALLLALVLLLGLVACGGKTGTPAQPDEPGNTQAPPEQDPPVKEDLPGEGYVAPNKEKRVLNILLLANSFGNRFVDELHDVFAAGGYEVNVCNIYKAGCTAPEHWANLTTNADNATENKYSFFITNQLGRTKRTNITTIQQALSFLPWDVIVFQHHFSPGVSVDADTAYNSCASAAKNMFDYLKENHPKAKLMWYETWAFEVGYSSVPDANVQTNMYNSIHEASLRICEENGVAMLPCGTAWQIARNDPSVGDTLCLADKAHDGDIQGGQFLNANVYFEVLFGESCIGNTFRPSYNLDEAKAANLQKAAHQAVLEYYGEAYYQ